MGRPQFFKLGHYRGTFLDVRQTVPYMFLTSTGAGRRGAGRLGTGMRRCVKTKIQMWGARRSRLPEMEEGEGEGSPPNVKTTAPEVPAPQHLALRLAAPQRRKAILLCSQMLAVRSRHSNCGIRIVSGRFCTAMPYAPAPRRAVFGGKRRLNPNFRTPTPLSENHGSNGRRGTGASHRPGTGDD
jgi:hypothetical protein